MVGGNQYVRSQNMTTSLELSPWEEWQNRVFGPINWQSENAPLYSLQNGLRKWEPSTVQNRRLRLTDTSMEDCPGDDDAVWYERDYETLPAEARACVIHGNCKKKKGLWLFRLHSHFFLCFFTHTIRTVVRLTALRGILIGFRSECIYTRF
jgi:hypothetical protein